MDVGNEQVSKNGGIKRRGGGGRSTSGCKLRELSQKYGPRDRVPWRRLKGSRGGGYACAQDQNPWVQDEVLIKMEDKPFAAGAMRECYAVKKLRCLHMLAGHAAACMGNVFLCSFLFPPE